MHTTPTAPKRGGEDEVIPLRADGEPAYYLVSASQLKVWWECQRKWAWQKLAGLKTPSGKGSALGSLMHDQAEPYLRDGTRPDFSFKNSDGVYPAEILAAGTEYLPAPKSPGMDVERYFKFPIPGQPRIFVRGFKDYRFGADHGRILKADGSVYLEADGRPHVGDHKSCGNWSYALTADHLLGDPQAVIYAYDELLRYPEADACTLQWTYYGTKKPYRGSPVTATITRAHVNELFAEIIRGSTELVTTYRARPSPLALPFNSDVCGKYGRDGCPFQGNCNLSPRERRPRMSNVTDTSSLIAKIEARKAAETGVPTGMTPLQAMIAKKRAAAAAAEVPAPPAPTVPVAPPPPPPAAETLPAWADPAQTPVDPHASKSLPTPAVFRAPPALPVSDQPINCATDFQPPPTSDAARVAEETAALSAIVPPKAAKGRPTGSKNAKAALEGVDPALITEFLTRAIAWFTAQGGAS